MDLEVGMTIQTLIMLQHMEEGEEDLELNLVHPILFKVMEQMVFV